MDATILRDNDVLEHLDGAEEYLYISGIAVSEQYRFIYVAKNLQYNTNYHLLLYFTLMYLYDHRRQKIATVLLKACDELSVLWGLDHLVLRAYEDDIGARELYTKAGYRVVTGDPPWTTSWIGRKRRVLMIKRSNPSKQTSMHSQLVILKQVSDIEVSSFSKSMLKKQHCSLVVDRYI